MTLGQIHYVYIVANAGPVDSIVVVAIYGQVWKFTGCYLGDIGEQVIWNAVWILAYQTAVVRATRVEIA